MTDLLCYSIFTAVTLLLVGVDPPGAGTSVIFGLSFFARTVNISEQILALISCVFCHRERERSHQLRSEVFPGKSTKKCRDTKPIPIIEFSQ